MKNQLPQHPNLEHLRRQAKSLLQEFRANHPEAIQKFAEHLPAARGLTPEQMSQQGYRLADAQSVVARATGFSGWTQLHHHVETLRRMEGSWAIISLKVSGQVIQEDMLHGQLLDIDGDMFRLAGGGASFEGEFDIDTSMVPYHMDFHFIRGPHAGQTGYGIFEFRGEELVFCLGLVGSPRPTAFESAPGTGAALEICRRVSGARPIGILEPTPEIPKVEYEWIEPVLTATHQKLEGEWKAVKIARDGQEFPRSLVNVATRKSSGTHLEVSIGGMTALAADFAVDESKDPIEIAYKLTDGEEVGGIQLGIMTISDNEIQTCFGPVGGPRPTKFETVAGDGATFSVWKRR